MKSKCDGGPIIDLAYSMGSSGTRMDCQGCSELGFIPPVNQSLHECHPMRGQPPIGEAAELGLTTK